MEEISLTQKERKKPTRLYIYKNPTRVLKEDLRNWFFEERKKFIAIKKPSPFERIGSESLKNKLQDLWTRAKVTGTKHPDIANLTFKKVSEDIIDSFDKIKKENISQRFKDTWEKTIENYYFTPYREFEEVFRELLELGCDESLLDYEGREINEEWIGLAQKIVIGLLAFGVVPGKDKHIFLRIPKLEPLSLEGIKGLDSLDVENIRKFFKNSYHFPTREEYTHYTEKYKNKEGLEDRLSNYEKVYKSLIDILHDVARTNLDVCYTLESLTDEALKNGSLNQSEVKKLDIDIERLPIYEISVPQINDIEDIDILIKTLREYIRAVEGIFYYEKVKYENDKLFKKCFDRLSKIRIVPLIENPALMMNLSDFITEFFEKLEWLRKDIFTASGTGSGVTYALPAAIHDTNFTIVDFEEKMHMHSLMRIWLARSDTALNYGAIAAEIARVLALSEREVAMQKLREKYKELSPDIQLLYGVGLPPFRGGLNPLDKTIWKHYPVDVTMQGIKFDKDEITVRQFVKVAKLFSFQCCLKKQFFEKDEDGQDKHNLEDLYNKELKLEDFLKSDEEWSSEFKLTIKDHIDLKRIMAESILIYWENISKLGTLIRYMDEVTPKLRSRLKTTIFSRENPKIDAKLFENVYLFSWDEIPGKDNGRLIEFIRQNYGIDWVKTAKIEKIDDGKTIKVSTEKNFLSLRINDEKTIATLDIDDAKTAEFIMKTENNKLSIYENVKLSDGQRADAALTGAMNKLNREWPPDKQSLKLSRAIKLNYFLTNCGLPPTLLDLGALRKISENDIILLKIHVPGLGHLIRNDYKLFIPDAVEILLDKKFVNDIEASTQSALKSLKVEPNSWTEAESNLMDVLLGDAIEHNALLLIAISTYKKEIPVRMKERKDNYDFFIDKLSQSKPNAEKREPAVKDRLRLFSPRYPENIKEALKNIELYEGDHRWIKAIYAGAKMAVVRGWAG